MTKRDVFFLVSSLGMTFIMFVEPHVQITNLDRPLTAKDAAQLFFGLMFVIWALTEPEKGS